MYWCSIRGFHNYWCTDGAVLVYVFVYLMYSVQYGGSPYVWCHGQSGRNDASHTRRSTRPEKSSLFVSCFFLQKKREKNTFLLGKFCACTKKILNMSI